MRQSEIFDAAYIITVLEEFETPITAERLCDVQSSMSNIPLDRVREALIRLCIDGVTVSEDRVTKCPECGQHDGSETLYFLRSKIGNN
jgi:hypothetical protein